MNYIINVEGRHIKTPSNSFATELTASDLDPMPSLTFITIINHLKHFLIFI